MSINYPCKFCLVILSALLFSCAEPIADFSTNEEDIFDLQNLNLQEKSIASLQGKWHYYWDTIVTHVDDVPNESFIYSGQIHVPNFWTVQSTDFLEHNPYGLLTLHTTLILPDTIKQYALKFNSVVSSYEIWANGQLLSRTGVVSRNLENTQPDFQSRIVSLPKMRKIDLFWVISNYHHRKGGGSWEPVLFGQYDQILELWKSYYSFDLFSSTTMLLIAAYHLILFFFYPKEKSYLFFALGILAATTRTITTGEMVVEELLTGFPYHLNQQLRYVGHYLSIGILGVFLYYFLESRFKKIAIGVISLTGIFSLLTLALPLTVTTHLVVYFHLLSPIILVLYAFMIIKALPTQPLLAKLVMIGLGLMSLVLIHAVLLSLNVISGSYFHERGFLAVIMCQVVILAVKHKRVYGERNTLETNLRHKEWDLASKERELTAITMLSYEKNTILQQLDDQVRVLYKKIDKEAIPSLEEIKKIIKSNLNEETWSVFMLQFEKVHPDFFSKLKDHFHLLTQYDLRLCAYLKVGIENKEIARISAISNDSVKKSVYRLKKKMELNPESDLRSYLMNF